MGTTYQITIRNETEETPHIIVFDPNADPNASDPPSPWRSIDPPSGHSVPVTFETDYGVIQVAATRHAAAARVNLEGIQSADLVVRGSESEGYSFRLENVQRD